MPITACDLLYERVLPFYEDLGVAVGAVLTDNGREFCGKPDSHPFELLLALEGIDHRTTKVRSPQTSGFVERMNRTLLDECFRVEGRKTWYVTPEEIQRDLDRFLGYYSLERSHQGYRLRGRTPAQALRECPRPRGAPAGRPGEGRRGREGRRLESCSGGAGFRRITQPEDSETRTPDQAVHLRFHTEILGVLGLLRRLPSLDMG